MVKRLRDFKVEAGSYHEGLARKLSTTDLAKVVAHHHLIKTKGFAKDQGIPYKKFEHEVLGNFASETLDDSFVDDVRNHIHKLAKYHVSKDD